MASGKNGKRGSGDGVDIRERGDVFFLYRPRVQVDDPGGMEDVERFHMVLRPDGGRRVRLIVIGRKKLPEAGDHERYWGFVDRIAESADALADDFEERHYETKTRGERTRPAARPAGEGRYVLLLHEGQLHLAYALEFPHRPGEVQKAFNIEREASYVVSVKNPEKGSPRNGGAGLGEERAADYPKTVQREFHGRRFAGEDPRLLDRQGAEFVLIGAHDWTRADIDTQSGAARSDKADIFRRLGLDRREHPAAPLFRGDWA